MLLGGDPQGEDGPPRSLHGLRLRAEDAEDLAVISACLQDALVSVRDLAYDRAARTFVLVANRFRWEANTGNGAGVNAGADRDGLFERTLCAVTFETVEGVAYRGFSRADEGRILSLLAVRHVSQSVSGGRKIDLEFAGSATIRLSVAAIRCRVGDFGEPWPTRWQPGHELEGPA